MATQRRNFRSEFTPAEHANLDKTIATRNEGKAGWTLTAAEKAGNL